MKLINLLTLVFVSLCVFGSLDAQNAYKVRGHRFSPTYDDEGIFGNRTMYDGGGHITKYRNNRPRRNDENDVFANAQRANAPHPPQEHFQAVASSRYQKRSESPIKSDVVFGSDGRVKGHVNLGNATAGREIAQRKGPSFFEWLFGSGKKQQKNNAPSGVDSPRF